ncbi:STAS domain-containing protein [Streptomyces sp. NPDC006978]|uniref:STAS domain-containing protein n=1 Tax=Streptomyces sp. NPDC006978 TaxID=3364769 RepID=UPI00367FC392
MNPPFPGLRRCLWSPRPASSTWNPSNPLAVEIEAVLAQHDSIVLDASGITFGDSMFLRLVLSIHSAADLRIAAPSPAVIRLLGVVGADTVLRIYPTVEDALAA